MLILFTFSGDCVELIRKRLTRPDVAALEDNGGGSEDEINCSGDVAVAVELTI